MSESPRFPLRGLGQRQPQPPQEYQAILDLIPHPALLIDISALTTLLANAAATQLSGYTRNELIGFSLPTLFPNWE